MIRRSVKKIRECLMPVLGSDIKPGDYVFACKYSDGDPNDRWCVGFVSEIGYKKESVLFKETGVIPFKYAVKISDKEGRALIRYTPKY